MSRLDDEVAYWDKAAKSKNLRNDYICDSEISDKQCLDAILPYLGQPRTILEIGSGIGRLTIPIAEHFDTAEVWGIDISPEMRARAPVHPRIHYGSGWPYFKLDAIYSMATFQHIETIAVIQYIMQAGLRLNKKGVFRFQFIVGDEDEPFSKHHDLWEIVGALKKADLKAEVEHGLVHPKWTWVTARHK